MDVIACRVEPVQGDLCQLWSKSRHGGNTIDSFVVDFGSALEDALVLLSTSSTSTSEGSKVCSLKTEQESLESPNNEFDNDQSPQKDPSSSFLDSSGKLISAMKGSRKKQGKNVGNLRVSWAPDVYDPPVTSQSHWVGSSHNHHSSSRHKKNYKNNKNKAKSHKNSRKSKGSSSR